MIGLLEAAPHVVYSFTLEQLWTGILGICGGITAVSAAIAVVIKAVNKAKEPDKKQNEQIEAHDKKFEDHDKKFEDVERKLKNDKDTLDLYRSKILSLEEHQKEQDIMIEAHSAKIAGAEQRLTKNEHGSNATMKALLALLSHGIDGNAVEPMKEAKAEIENYLING